MASQITVQQWTEKYNQLDQNLKSINQKISSYLDAGGGDSPALFDAQRLQLRLEYQINQHIDSAYTPALIDTYQAYQNQKIDIKTNISIDGILYNNIGQPLTWDPNSHWGQFNQFREVRSFIRSAADFHLASWMQDKKADIVALFNGLISEVLDPSDIVFGSVLDIPNPATRLMALQTLQISMGKAMPDFKSSVSLGYDNVYQFLFGDYDPTLDGSILPPTLLTDSV